MSIPYLFAPWSRRGLARAHQNSDEPIGTLEVRPRITIGLTLQAREPGKDGVVELSGNVKLAMYGPADIIGIDTRLIVRTDPKPNVTNFEPNYRAIVDFDPPDFPWLLTPARASGKDHLRPWLVLVVLERTKTGLPTLAAGNSRPLPSITVRAADVKTELPDLKDSWKWAHTQAVSDKDPGDIRGLSNEFNEHPSRSISRLVCPRRLQEGTRYVACLVPATDGGRLRGLGEPLESDNLGPAWSSSSTGDVELPVYFHWEFATGPVGDIETLARRLRTPKQYEEANVGPLPAVGTQPVAVDAEHLLFEGATPGKTEFEGALVPLGFKPADPDPTFASHLETILNSGDERAIGNPPDAGNPDEAKRIPTLGPPIYGEHPANRHRVDATKVGQQWLDELNCQPRYRIAAGWGAEIVRQNQDEFMQAAWEQVGDVLDAERAFSRARLSRDVLKCVHTRHLGKLAPERLLALMAPARARVRVATDASLHGRIAGATLPHELFDGSMRRLVCPRRAVFRNALPRTGPSVASSVAGQMGALVQTFAQASKHLDAVDPNRFVPDGLLGSRAYDAVPLPKDPTTLIDLKPYTGFAQTLTGAEVQAIQRQNAAAREQAAKTTNKPPTEGDPWHKGLLTETHAIRIAELRQIAGQRLEGDLAALIQQSSKRGTQGVLLSVRQGAVTSQPLRIDARNGALKVHGPALAIDAKGQVVRTVRETAQSLASVPRQALKSYGSRAVFESLPPSTLGQEKTEIQMIAPGRFAAAESVAPAQVATITLPPAIKDRATLKRYSQAFKEYAKVLAPPAASLPAVVAVDFRTATVVSAAYQRVDPVRSVPARLASMLSIGTESVSGAGGRVTGSFIATWLDPALTDRLRYVVPTTFDRVMAYPHLRFPLAVKLASLSSEAFLPGAGSIPDDVIMVVETNPRFVEALMLGANHEMVRKMLWQGYPTDSRGTPFRRFWQRTDDKKDDIEPIDRWVREQRLGKQQGSPSMLVLLIRGQLLERFPNLAIYAYPAGQAKRPGGSEPPLPAGTRDDAEMKPDQIKWPAFRGHLNQDITYVGFDITRDEIGKYFFIIEEHMTEPRFWLGDPLDESKWNGSNAAAIAVELLHHPFRGFWRGGAFES